MTASLDGHVAVISGGLGDIGQAVGIELARRGAAVALGDLHDVAAAREVLDRIDAAGRGSHYQQVDVRDPAAVDAWVRTVEAELGIPTLVVPSAAQVTTRTLRELTASEWQDELRTNLDGAFHLARTAALRLVDARREGRIVFLGSWAAQSPHTGLPAYSVAKAGLSMLVRCMALEFAPDGILVNEVAPGYVDAGLSGRAFAEQPELRERAAAVVPVGRLITAEEVALQVAHLCDPDTRHITGAAIVMDGGLSLVTPAASIRRDG